MATGAGLDVFGYVSFEGVPVVDALNEFDSLVFARVAGKGRVMISGKNLGSFRDVGDFGDAEEGFGKTDDLFVVMHSFVDVWRSGEEVGLSVKLPWLMSEFKVVFLKLGNPVSLSAREILWFVVILKIPMVSDNVDDLRRP